jgi:hypothetical protein
MATWKISGICWAPRNTDQRRIGDSEIITHVAMPPQPKVLNGLFQPGFAFVAGLTCKLIFIMQQGPGVLPQDSARPRQIGRLVIEPNVV